MAGVPWPIGWPGGGPEGWYLMYADAERCIRLVDGIAYPTEGDAVAARDMLAADPQDAVSTIETFEWVDEHWLQFDASRLGL